jgi:KTSC domain
MAKFKRNHANSTMITSLAYRSDAQVLEVVFCNGGIYEYAQFSEMDYQDLVQAKSIGEHFNLFVRNNFPYFKVRE